MFGEQPQPSGSVFENIVHRTLRKPLLGSVARHVTSIVDREPTTPEADPDSIGAIRIHDIGRAVANRVAEAVNGAVLPSKEASLLIAQPQGAIALRSDRTNLIASPDSSGGRRERDEPLPDQSRDAKRGGGPQAASAVLVERGHDPTRQTVAFGIGAFRGPKPARQAGRRRRPHGTVTGDGDGGDKTIGSAAIQHRPDIRFGQAAQTPPRSDP